MPTAKDNRLVKFGPYVADLVNRELTKLGVRILLQIKPFQILEIFLQRPNELITREELQEKIWPSGTFVDFEQGLNKAVNKLRVALCDTAENPKFVETVPRLGYRFIAQVEVEARPAAPADVIGNVAEKRSHSQRWTVLAFGLTLVLLLTYWVWRTGQPPKVSNYVRLTHDGQPKRLIGTDGPRLFINLGNWDVHGIAQVAVTGGDMVKISTPSPNMFGVGISRDDSELLLADNLNNIFTGPLWSFSVTNGTARRLGEAEGQTAAWSPDGKTLAYAHEGKLFLANADGSSPRLVGDMEGPVSTVTWSPDGSHLRFSTWNMDALRGTVWEMTSGGGELRRLLPQLNSSGSACCGVWSTDGKYYVFTFNDQLWVLPRRSKLLPWRTNPVQITASPVDIHWPIFSKDGKKLYAVGKVQRGELQKYDLSSKRFAPFLGGVSAEFVDFSPDGKSVLYVAYPQGTLWRSNADGSNPVQLTAPPIYAMLPRWSPDGHTIAFYGVEADKAARIYTAPAEGGTPTEILSSDTTQQMDPSWSPDGRQMAFGGKANDVTGSIRILDLSSGQITSVPGSEGFYGPRWSPSGRYIVASNSNSSALMLFDFTTKTWSALTTNGEGWPNWSKDERYIYALRWGASPAVLRVSVKDRNIKEVVKLTEFLIAGKYDGALALDPNESPVLLRNVGTQDVYALDWEEP